MAGKKSTIIIESITTYRIVCRYELSFILYGESLPRKTKVVKNNHLYSPRICVFLSECDPPTLSLLQLYSETYCMILNPYKIKMEGSCSRP